MGWITWRWHAVNLTGYTSDGLPGITPDWFGGEEGGEEASLGGIPSLMPYGLIGRPKQPDASGACHCLVGDAGAAQSFVIPLFDPRLASAGKVPVLSEGSSCIYADWGGWIQLDDATKTINIYNPYTSAPAKAHTIQIGLDSSDQEIISILHGSGSRISMVGEVIKIADKTGNVFVQVDSSGWTLWGNGKVLGAMDVGITSFALAKAAQVTTALQAIATALGAGANTTTGVLNGAAVAVPIIEAAATALPTTMLKGF